MQSLELESELESDTSSINEGMTGSGGHHMPMMVTNSGGTSNMPASREQLEKRIDSLLQENRVLKMEIETDRMRIKSLQEENKELRKASVSIQVLSHSYNLFYSILFKTFIYILFHWDSAVVLSIIICLKKSYNFISWFSVLIMIITKLI